MNQNEKSKMKSNILVATYVVVLSYVFLNVKAVVDTVYYVLDVLNPFIMAIGIAFVLNIPMKFFENVILGPLDPKNKLAGFKRPIAIVLTLITISALIVTLTLFIIPQLVESIATLMSSIPDSIKSFEQLMQNNVGSTDMLNDIWKEIMAMWKEIIQVVGQITGTLLSKILNITLDVTSTVFMFFISIILAIYMLASKEILILQLKKFIFAFVKKDKADYIMEIATISNFKFSKFVQGQCTEAVIIGLLCYVGMILFKMPYALLISTIVGVTALVPILGAFIGTVPGVFIIFTVNPVQALWFIVFIIVIQQLEGNLIYPRVVGSTIGLSGIWVLFVTIVFGSMFGIVGILIGIPLMGVVYTVLGTIVNKRIQEKGIKIK